ncbi:MAG: DUF4198 domain-containing protein [Acidobacteriota bacterium]
MRLFPVLVLRPLLAVGLVAMVATPAAAHDYWIEPQSFTVEPGSLVQLDLRVGDEAPGESLPFDPTHAETFSLVGGDGQRPVLGRPGARPAGNARLGEAGLYAVAYGSAARSVTLSPASFESYLREEGLDSVIARRSELGETDQPGRELFARCAKTLMTAGASPVAFAAGPPASEHPALAPLGLELEIVAEQIPAAGRELSLRLLLRGEPLSGLRVRARPLGEPASATFRTADSTGRVLFELPSAGPWIVTAVHMERAEAAPDHEWRSLWASLTFLAAGGD